ncbi:uncharacterized protein LOC134846447 isoform X2 [Symsagittifera roscoffensis]|uniref:uncharacterized protein LOC134846447 isoform X2 n=1 Tax=Symsagittifera roscoffensis TaxID=84072 RepID=UPI00307B16FF
MAFDGVMANWIHHTVSKREADPPNSPNDLKRNSGGGSGGSGGGSGGAGGGNAGGVAPFEFMKSAYFVVVISLSIICGLIILIFVTRYARRQYAKGHLDTHLVKRKHRKELTQEIAVQQLRSHEEVDCDPVLLTESLSGVPVNEETEKSYYFRMKALDQIHDLDDCIVRSCKSDNPQVLKQIARAPRSDLKNYFRKVREPIHIDDDQSSGGKSFSSGKRKRRKSNPQGLLRGDDNRKSVAHPGMTTQGPLWGTNLELTKNFRIEYDVARFGPAPFNANRYSQYTEALNQLKQSITSQSKPLKNKRQGAGGSMMGGSKAVSSVSHNKSTSGGQSSLSKGLGESVAFASISGAPVKSINNQQTSHRNQHHNLTSTAQALLNNPRSNIQHRKQQQRSKLQVQPSEEEYFQLTPTASVRSDISAANVNSLSREGLRSFQNTNSNTKNSLKESRPSNRYTTDLTTGVATSNTVNSGTEFLESSVEESSDTDATVERLPLLPRNEYSNSSQPRGSGMTTSTLNPNHSVSQTHKQRSTGSRSHSNSSRRRESNL